VRFETSPAGYSYSNPQAHTTFDPSHQASGPLPPFPNYPNFFNFGYGPPTPNLAPISNGSQPGPYVYPQYYDGWQESIVPSAMPGGMLAPNYNAYSYGSVGSTRPIHDSSNPSPPSLARNGSNGSYEDGFFMPQYAVDPVDFIIPAGRNSFSDAPSSLSRRLRRNSDSDSDSNITRPGNRISSDSESSEMNPKNYGITRNKSSIPHNLTKENFPPYVEKVTKAAAYRSRAEGRLVNPFAPVQAPLFPVPPPSSFSSGSAQTADPPRSIATSSSKASRSTKSSSSSRVLSTISSNTSVDIEDGKDDRKIQQSKNYENGSQKREEWKRES
jgi:hypothetical protein